MAVAVVATGVLPAGAAPPSTSGAANQGSVTGDFGDGPVSTGVLARCMMTGTSNAHLEAYHAGSTARLGPGDSSCVRNNDGSVDTRATTSFGAIDSVRDAAGLGLELHDYVARCTATATSATVAVTVGSVHAGSRIGLAQPDTLPTPIPRNYRVAVQPGRSAGGTLVFNEQLANGTGGYTISAVHYKQNGGGEIYLGRADCSPLG